MNSTGLQPTLAADNLHKSYPVGNGHLQVLRGVSLHLLPGEVCALMGASGSGKSTLLHLLGLLDRPDQGSIRIDGEPTANLGHTGRARRRAAKVGFVFQQFQLLPELTALENVLMPRRLVKGSWLKRRQQERQRAREILQAVGLQERLQHRPTQLSGGEQQRVAIARALVSRPPLLLADEPTGNLDSATGQEVLELLLRLAKEHQAAVLLATHDSRVAEHCDRLLRLHDGSMVVEDLGPSVQNMP